MSRENSMQQAWVDAVPYWNREAIKAVGDFLNESSKVFEYGSGGSTVWLAKRVGELISVEYDSNWFKSFERRFRNEFPMAVVEEDRIHCAIMHPLGFNKQISIFLKERPTKCGKEFVNTILLFPDNYFDLVIVDARNRAKCLRLARDKVKPNGMIFLDDSQRPWYKKGIEQLGDWESMVFGGGKVRREAMLFWRKNERNHFS